MIAMGSKRRALDLPKPGDAPIQNAMADERSRPNDMSESSGTSAPKLALFADLDRDEIFCLARQITNEGLRSCFESNS